MIPYRDQGGRLTVGWGHRTRNHEPISQTQADALLDADVAEAMEAVRYAITVALTPRQEEALVSLVYNIGAKAFRQSTLLRKLNAGKPVGDEFLRWVYVDGELSQGLLRRRKAEKELFCSSSLS